MSTLQKVIDLKPQVISLPLSEVKLSANEEMPIATVHGLNAVLSATARKNLIAMAGYNDQAINTFKTNYGQRFAEKILGDAFKRLGHQRVSLAFDGPRITRILTPDKRAASLNPVQIAGIAEMFVKKGMFLHGVQTAPDGTFAKIQLSTKEVWENKGLPGEELNSGIEFQWDAFGGTTVHEFLIRLICTNGLTSKKVKGFNQLNANSDPAEIYQALFSRGAEKMLAAHWARIAELQEKPMSASEFFQVSDLLQRFDKDTDVIENHFGERNLGAMRWMRQYEKRSMNLLEMNKSQLRHAPTPVKWWDAINAMTWFGSHPNQSGVDEWDASELLGIAGKMMDKPKDADNWVLDAPKFN